MYHYINAFRWKLDELRHTRVALFMD